MAVGPQEIELIWCIYLIHTEQHTKQWNRNGRSRIKHLWNNWGNFLFSVFTRCPVFRAECLQCVCVCVWNRQKFVSFFSSDRRGFIIAFDKNRKILLSNSKRTFVHSHWSMTTDQLIIFGNSEVFPIVCVGVWHFILFRTFIYIDWFRLAMYPCIQWYFDCCVCFFFAFNKLRCLSIRNKLSIRWNSMILSHTHTHCSFLYTRIQIYPIPLASYSINLSNNMNGVILLLGQTFNVHHVYVHSIIFDLIRYDTIRAWCLVLCFVCVVCYADCFTRFNWRSTHKSHH